MDILGAAEKEKDFAVNTRRILHRNPELSGKETETLEFIKQKLREASIPFTEIEDGGIVAEITGEKASPSGKAKTLFLRADIDALPINENQSNLCRKRDVISERPGVMHACGHDAHTAILLAAAKILFQNRKEFYGKVLAVFERGEEGLGLLKNILEYFEKKKVLFDGAHAIHVRPDLEAGKIAVLSGPVFASPLVFDITIKGKGGHGSRPDLANSPLDCFTHFYSALKTLRERYISPFEPITVNVGTVHFGEMNNVIADELHFSGSARVYSEKTANKFTEELENLLITITKAFHCTFVKNRFGNPLHPIINTREMAVTGQNAVSRYMGEIYLLREYEPMMCSDDFASLCTICPTLMVHLGIKNENKGSGGELHSAEFDIDEETLTLGIAETTAFTLEFFGET